MKAIVNVPKANQYSRFNGLTFEVKDVTNITMGLLGLDKNYPNNQTDFSFNEIIVVDLVKEISDNVPNKDLFMKLTKYAEVNKINFLI